jgi:hypothetical protein
MERAANKEHQNRSLIHAIIIRKPQLFLNSGPQCADESAATAPLGVLETTDSQKKYLCKRLAKIIIRKGRIIKNTHTHTHTHTHTNHHPRPHNKMRKSTGECEIFFSICEEEERDGRRRRH